MVDFANKSKVIRLPNIRMYQHGWFHPLHVRVCINIVKIWQDKVVFINELEEFK